MIFLNKTAALVVLMLIEKIGWPKRRVFALAGSFQGLG